MYNDALYMELALNEARQPSLDVPVGCIIVMEDSVIARAFNLREQTNDPTAHAEILCLREAARSLSSWRLDGSTVYCTLEPCPMCAEAIIQARVGRVVFGAYDPISGAAGSAFNLFTKGRALPVPEVVGGILEERCRNLLLQFFQSRRNRTEESIE